MSKRDKAVRLITGLYNPLIPNRSNCVIREVTGGSVDGLYLYTLNWVLGFYSIPITTSDPYIYINEDVAKEALHRYARIHNYSIEERYSTPGQTLYDLKFEYPELPIIELPRIINLKDMEQALEVPV